MLSSMNRIINDPYVKWTRKTKIWYQGTYDHVSFTEYLNYRKEEGLINKDILAITVNSVMVILLMFSSIFVPFSLGFKVLTGLTLSFAYILFAEFLYYQVFARIDKRGNSGTHGLVSLIKDYKRFKENKINVSYNCYELNKENQLNLSVTSLWLNMIVNEINENYTSLTVIDGYGFYDRDRDDYLVSTRILKYEDTDRKLTDKIASLNKKLNRLFLTENKYIQSKLTTLDNKLSDTILTIESKDVFSLSKDDRELYLNIIHKIVDKMNKYLDNLGNNQTNSIEVDDDLSIEFDYLNNLHL